VNVARDARGVRFASREAGGDRRYTIGRNFQGSIQGGDANVLLDVGGAVQKGSSLVTGGNAAVNVTRNFDGVVEASDLEFRVAGNVSAASRIVASRVWRWYEPEVGPLSPSPNFLIGGRLDGVVNVGVFDAYDGLATVTIIGGGAGTSARFYVGRFETDSIVIGGNFQGNVRVLQDLATDLQFTGNLDRITIGGQVFADITVGGTLLSLNSNSWFRPTGSGKRTGSFIDAGLDITGTLTTGKYVTVGPVLAVGPFATWAAPSGTTATGMLGSIGVTVTSAGPENLLRNSYDLSNPADYAVPGTAATPCIDFTQERTTTIAFAAPVSNLVLYTKYWRPGNYTLVAKDAANNDVAYSFLSGNATPPVTGNTFTSAGPLLDGIIRFSRAVQSITIDPVTPGYSALTLATLA
jgi:hypothetical protein